MKSTRPDDWARRLRPLHLGEPPVADQFIRRRGVTWVATMILVGIGGFVLAIFTGFGRWDLGLALSGGFVGPLLGWIWWDQLRLSGAVRAYLEVDPSLNPGDEPPSRSDLG